MPRTRKVLVSACLLGRRCRYDGTDNHDPTLESELEARNEEPIAFCPEQEGGLTTPRPAAWLERSAAEVLAGRGRVITRTGADVTREFVRGAESAVRRCRELGIEHAYLKERSPSCGVHHTHVDGALVEGAGITAEALAQAGIKTAPR